MKARRKEFQKLWTRARNDGWTVKAESAAEVVVTTDRYQIEHQWSWAHCGMAMLAHREGVDVATDSFWFPKSATAETGIISRSKESSSTDQLRMFCPRPFRPASTKSIRDTGECSVTPAIPTETHRFPDSLLRPHQDGLRAVVNAPPLFQ